MTLLSRQAIPYQLFMPQMQEVYVMPKGAHGRPIVRTSTGRFIDTTGSTTDGIQEALDYLETDGGKLRIAGGDYTIASSRLIYNSSKPISICGAGWNTKITWNPIATNQPTNDLGMLNIYGVGDSDHCTYVSIQDLYFDFGSNSLASYDSYKRGIHIFNADNVYLERCRFKGARGEMVGLGNLGSSAPPNAIVTDCYFEDWAQTALNPNMKNCRVSNCHFKNGSQGIEAGSYYFICTGCDFENLKSIGILLASSRDFVISGNRLTDCLTATYAGTDQLGFIYLSSEGSVDQNQDGVIIGNSLIGRANQTYIGGIVIWKGTTSSLIPTRIGIIGNTVIGTATPIYIHHGNDFYISGNRIGTAAKYTATTISIDTSDNSFNDSASKFVLNGFAVGMRIKSTGCTNGANNRNDFIISSITAAKIIVNAVTPDMVTEVAGASITIQQAGLSAITIENTTDCNRNMITGNHATGHWVNGSFVDNSPGGQGNRFWGNVDESGMINTFLQTSLEFNSGPVVRAGSGSPESVITAPVGSIFLRTDGGAGTSIYVKESGTGNTGWVAK